MKNLISIIVIAIVTLLLTTCGQSTVGPEFPAGRRDYTWTVDTLKPGNESFTISRIWGSSPTDIWVIGSSSATFTTIWHYNGKQWRCDSIPRAVQPSGLHGFASNEVWMGNVNSTIWKFNGLEWKKYSEHKFEDYQSVIISDFSGKSNSNFYAVGGADRSPTKKYRGVIMKYDGYVWQIQSIPELRVGFSDCEYDEKNNVLVISGTEYENGLFIPHVYCYDGKELKELPVSSDWDINKVVKLGEEIFVSVGSKIYSYNNKQLTLWKDNTNTQINSYIQCGRNSSDFFVMGRDGIYHFNGKDFYKIYNKTAEVWNGIIFEKDVYFTGYIPQTGKNIIIHGKLN